MKIIGASALISCDKKNDFAMRNGALVISDDRILDIGDFNFLKEKYNAESIFYKNHILLPALINSHIHFEFSKNDTSFAYGSFNKWLSSVMDNRGEVLKKNKNAMINALKVQKKNGVGSICAISSYDLDLEMLLDSKLRVIFCHEAIGALSENFQSQATNISQRLEKSLKLKNNLFLPALAIHAPYSVNEKLANYTIQLAKKYNLLVSTHFLESSEELTWLTNANGYFKDFYANYFGIKDSKPNFNIDDFLNLFDDIRAIFVHCMYASDDIKKKIYAKKHSIISCPRSNLLLSGKMGENHIIATDGKSSNTDVEMLKEARLTLFTNIQKLSLQNKQYDIEILSRNIIYAMTCNPANALNLNNGILKKGKNADIAIFKLDSKLDSIATNFILNAKNVARLIVNGRDIL